MWTVVVVEGLPFGERRGQVDVTGIRQPWIERLRVRVMRAVNSAMKSGGARPEQVSSMTLCRNKKPPNDALSTYH